MRGDVGVDNDLGARSRRPPEAGKQAAELMFIRGVKMTVPMIASKRNRMWLSKKLARMKVLPRLPTRLDDFSDSGLLQVKEAMRTYRLGQREELELRVWPDYGFYEVKELEPVPFPKVAASSSQIIDSPNYSLPFADWHGCVKKENMVLGFMLFSLSKNQSAPSADLGGDSWRFAKLLWRGLLGAFSAGQFGRWRAFDGAHYFLYLNKSFDSGTEVYNFDKEGKLLGWIKEKVTGMCGGTTLTKTRILFHDGADLGRLTQVVDVDEMLEDNFDSFLPTRVILKTYLVQLENSPIWQCTESLERVYDGGLCVEGSIILENLATGERRELRNKVAPGLSNVSLGLLWQYVKLGLVAADEVRIRIPEELLVFCAHAHAAPFNGEGGVSAKADTVVDPTQLFLPLLPGPLVLKK